MSDSNKDAKTIFDLPIEILEFEIWCHLSTKNFVSFCLTCKYHFEYLTDKRVIELQDKHKKALLKKEFEAIRARYINETMSRKKVLSHIESIDVYNSTVMVLRNTPLYNCLIGRGYKPKANMIVTIELYAKDHKHSEATTFYKNIKHDFEGAAACKEGEEKYCTSVAKAVEEIEVCVGNSYSKRFSQEFIRFKEESSIACLLNTYIEDMYYRLDISPILSKLTMDDVKYGFQTTRISDYSYRVVSVEVSFFTKTLDKTWLSNLIDDWKNRCREAIEPYGMILPNRPSMMFGEET